ncbi:hypothetical protein D3C80_713460 [compost metagenome]
MSFGKQANTRQVQLTVAGEGFTPAPRHVGNRFGCAGQGAVQRVFGAAMNDALALEALATTEAGAFHQNRRIAQPAQTGIEPKPGNPGADNQDVGGNNGWHESTSQAGTGAQYTT